MLSSSGVDQADQATHWGGWDQARRRRPGDRARGARGARGGRRGLRVVRGERQQAVRVQGKVVGRTEYARMDCENNPERLHQVDGPIDARPPQHGPGSRMLRTALKVRAGPAWGAPAEVAPARRTQVCLRLDDVVLDLTPSALGAACSYYAAGWSDQHTPRATRDDAPPSEI